MPPVARTPLWDARPWDGYARAAIWRNERELFRRARAHSTQRADAVGRRAGAGAGAGARRRHVPAGRLRLVVVVVHGLLLIDMISLIRSKSNLRCWGKFTKLCSAASDGAPDDSCLGLFFASSRRGRKCTCGRRSAQRHTTYPQTTRSHFITTNHYTELLTRTGERQEGQRTPSTHHVHVVD